MKPHPVHAKKPAAFFAAALIAVLSACGQTPPKTAATHKAAEKPPIAITEQAQKALAQAEADVRDARARFALWTTAEAALNLAREAAQAGDSATVLKQAAFASDQARKGLAQLAYPSTELR